MIDNNSIINLESLLNLSTKLNESLDLDFIFSSSMLSLMGKLKVNKMCSFLKINDQFHSITCKGNNVEITLNEFIVPNKFSKINPDYQNSELFIRNGYKYILPLNHQNLNLGFILLGESFTKNEFSDEEMKYAEIVAFITSSSLANTLNYRKLESEKNNIEKSNFLLGTMVEISKDFTSFLVLKDIIRTFSWHLMGHLLVNKFAVFIKKNKDYEELINKFEQHIPVSFLDSLSQIQNTTTIDNIQSYYTENLKDCCIAAVSPMIYHAETKGIVLIGKKINNEILTEENIAIVDALTNTLTAAIENHRLLLAEIEKKKMEQDLNLALEIQLNLLPKSMPKIKGYDVAGQSKPSRAVGGDYFDVIRINDTEFIVIIADVSGKGVPASLLMANLQATIHTLAPFNLSLNMILQNINNLIFKNTSNDKFITLFILKINTENNEISYINAGHNPPILFHSNNTTTELSEGGIILGILENIPDFTETTIKIQPNDIILLYTDGLTDALDKNQDEFSTKRIYELMSSNLNNPAQIIVNNYFNEVQTYSAGIEQYDDITIIVLKRI